MTTEPARLAGIPVLAAHFPSNHACLAAQRMNQALNRTAGNSMFVRITSPSHVIRPIVTQFARESFGICRFRGSCIREYDLI